MKGIGLLIRKGMGLLIMKGIELLIRKGIRLLVMKGIGFLIMEGIGFSGRIRCGIHTKKWQQRNELPKHLASLCFFLLMVYLKTVFLTQFGLLSRVHHLSRSFFSLIFSIFLPCNKIGFHTT